MIKINLLPPEERGKGVEEEIGGGFKLDLRIIAPATLLIISAIVIFVWWMSLNNKKEELDQNIAKVKADLAKVQREERIVKELDDKKAKLKTHLGVITDLDQGRLRWVKILDIVSQALPELTWIERMSDESIPNSPSISIEGVAFSNQKIAEFMKNLADSELVEDTDSITLRHTTTKTEKRQDRTIELVSFALKVQLKSSSQPQPATGNRAQRG